MGDVLELGGLFETMESGPHLPHYIDGLTEVHRRQGIGQLV